MSGKLKPPRPRLTAVCAAMASALAATAPALAADAPAQPVESAAPVEFATDFVVGSQPVDLSRFGKANAVLPGVYTVDVFVNQGWIARMPVRFEAQSGEANAQAVFSQSQLEQLGVAVKLLPAETAGALAAGQTLRIDDAVADAVAHFDFGEQRLALSVPQAALSRQARGTVDPAYWDSGVTAGILGYDANVYRYGASGMPSRTQTYLGLNAGVNAGGWRLRHLGSYQNNSLGGSRYQATSTFAQHDLTAWRSQLTLGDAFTSGDLFDSTGFRGLSIQSDDRMLPESMRGYAPTVRGVAATNAQVTIRQNGNVIYQTTVAPGAFVIDDLYPTGYGGDLHVTVLEADGRAQTFTVPYSAVPLSLRPGVNRFGATLGQVRDNRLHSAPLFAQATWQRGLTNTVTGYGGAIAAPGYGAALVGGVLNTSVGAFGLDVTQAVTHVPGSGRRSGASLRGTYSKLITQTGTNVALAAYRYSTNGYYSLGNAMQARDQRPDGGLQWRPRNRLQATLNQNLGERWGRLYLVGSAANYWNRSGSNVSYSAGYSNTIGKVGFNISAARQRSNTGRMDTLYYVNFSIPLGGKQPATVSANVTRTSDGLTSVQTTLSGSLGEDGTLSYGLSAGHSSGGGSNGASGSAATGNANIAYRGPLATLAASAGAGPGYTQGGLGIQGAVVAHPGGITLSQPVSDTIGIVEAKDAGGARVLNAAGVRVDRRGYAVVPYLTPYAMNSVNLDPKGLSTDVELQTTSQQVAPRAGSVTVLRYATVSGRTAVIHARQADGSPLPFGASVLDESGSEIGIVGQASRIVARGLQEQGELRVKWSDKPGAACRIAYTLPAREKNRKADAAYEQIEADCKPLAP